MDTNPVGLTHTGTGKSRQMINNFTDCILIVHVVLRSGQGGVTCWWSGLKPTVGLAIVISSISLITLLLASTCYLLTVFQ